MLILKKCIHILTLISYVLIFIYAVLCLPYLMKYRPLVVLTGSMEPTYKVGSILYYHKVPEENLKVDDVITFAYEDGTIITHRINAVINNEYQTKGDANNTPDVKKITYDQILGKVGKFSIPYLGYYVSFINTHIYLILIVAIILLSEFLLSFSKTVYIDKKERMK